MKGENMKKMEALSQCFAKIRQLETDIECAKELGCDPRPLWAIREYWKKQLRRLMDL